MAGVVGLSVFIKLRSAQNNVVYGIVQEVAPNSHLTLKDVLFPESNTRWPSWTVQATAIENLEVVSSIPYPTPPPPPPSSHPSNMSPHPGSLPPIRHAPYPPPPIPSHHHQQQHHQAQFQRPTTSTSPTPVAELSAAPSRHASAPAAAAAPTFIDPAIISYGNASPARPPRPSKPAEMETPVKAMLAKAAINLPSPGSPFIGDIGKANLGAKLAAAKSTAAAPPQHQLQQPPVPVDSKPSVEAILGDAESASKKKVRRGQKTKKPTTNGAEAADPPPVMNSEVSRNGNDMNGQIKRGKGWRSTPLLQPSPAPAANPLDRANTKKSRRRQKEEQAQEFAQGDTTDIPDVDFDFESELKKFDKKQVFDEIRQGDTTADEDRLVSHNKARPGTYGGKNLHPTENVLSPKIDAKYNSNELDSSSDADKELNFANGRSSSKHSVSRAVFPKTRPSRQNSTQVHEPRAPPHPLNVSLSSDRARNRSTTSLATRSKHTASLATSSPRPDRPNSPHSAVSTARMPFQEAAKAPHFAIQPHLAACPTLLPGALHSLEKATVATYGLPQESITESAARCIAEAALQLSDLHGGIRRPSRTNTLRGSMTSSMNLGSPNEASTVVVLAGNHDIGARALAAARHLLGRNVKVIAAESLFETADTQDPQVKAQTSILRKMTHGGAKIKRGLWSKAQRHIKNLTGPPAVIIDGLLAGATFESLLNPNADFSARVQQETREMIEWANRSRAPVLSIGCPSGVSGIDGISTIVEGEPLSIRPDKVLALGAPMKGLLNAIIEGERCAVSLADIGINIGLKSDEQVAFGGSWVVDLKVLDE